MQKTKDHHSERRQDPERSRAAGRQNPERRNPASRLDPRQDQCRNDQQQALLRDLIIEQSACG